MQNFPQEIIEAAQRAQRRYGVFASITLAQWALESDYGRHVPPGSNNPFGIKARTGQPGVETATHEFRAGTYYRVTQTFAKFPTVADAFDAHAELLATSHYYDHARRAKCPADYATALTGVYATDPHYGAKLISIMSVHKLTQFDI